MQPMQHQMMGYDRGATMFSPDGRLLQVEYAKKTVSKGSSAIGMTCTDGVVLVCDKRIMDDLIVPESVEKIFQIDEHLMASASGIVSDARVLIERAQIKAQQHKLTYDSPIDTLSVVKDVCSLMQVCTQSGGLRPFGVSLLVGGVDDEEPILFETDPTGIYFQYKATALGEGEAEIKEILKKEYKSDLDMKSCVGIAVKALIKVIGNDISEHRIDIGFIDLKDKQFKKMSNTKTFDKEKVSFHIARLKKGGEVFEISVYPENAIRYMEGEKVDITEIVQSEKIFADVDKGLLAAETKMKTLFNTSDFQSVAKIILDDGELQLTAEYRSKLREQKRNRILAIIHKNVVDPRTHLPHPLTRLEAAMEQAKVKVDEFKKAEDQITEIVKKLQPIIPIKFEKLILKIVASANHSGKVYAICQNNGTILKGDWTNDGSWVGELEIPAGIQNDVMDKLNNATHGDVEITIGKRM